MTTLERAPGNPFPVPSRRLTVYLQPATLAALQRLAEREDRATQAQAGRLIADALRREGLLSSERDGPR